MLSDQIILSNRLKIENVILTEDEQKESDLEGKRKKFNKLKHGKYWEDQELHERLLHKKQR